MGISTCGPSRLPTLAIGERTANGMEEAARFSFVAVEEVDHALEIVAAASICRACASLVGLQVSFLDNYATIFLCPCC